MTTPSRPRPVFRDLTRAPLSSAPQTPRRPYTPSTPHAILAHQARSGAATSARTTRITKLRADLAKPVSARQILRRFAHITAKESRRRISTPAASVAAAAAGGKENVARKSLGFLGRDDDDEDEDEDGDMQRPDFSISILREGGEQEDSEIDIGEPPTPSLLLGGEYDPTVTFRSVEREGARDAAFAAPPRMAMSARSERRVSRITVPFEDIGVGDGGGGGGGGDEDEDGNDRTVEIGGRAVSEEYTGRLFPRSSFGSIRMSDFGVVEKRVSAITDGRGRSPVMGNGDGDDYDFGGGIEEDLDLGRENETEVLRRFRKSPSMPNDVSFQGADVQDDEDTFALQFPLEGRRSHSHPPQPQSEHEDADSDVGSVSDDAEGQPDQRPSPSISSPRSRNRPMTPIEIAASKPPRQRKVKLTRHGIAIPALPSSLIKRLAVESMTRRGKRKPKIDRASLTALEQATEWFFEQVGEDLEAYSNHAGRKKRIDASDMLTLMRRQRLLKEPGALQDLAEEYLERENLAELDLPEVL